jgi:tyrosyl-tRNA synthetase
VLLFCPHLAGDAPSCSLPASQLVGAALTDVMVAAGMLKSKGEVRRLIKGGGVYMNNTKVRAPHSSLHCSAHLHVSCW